MLGQDGRAGTGWVAAISVLLAGVLLTAVGVAALRTDTASADTVLARGDDARLVLADGTARTAVVGERVPRGATVTAAGSGAVLETRGRRVHLGAASAVTVLDGARQALREGFVMVDASDAPGLELSTTAATVTSRDDSLVRVDGGPLVRVGVLRGDAASVRAAGRRATSEVRTYFQVQVPRGGLPGAESPFVLTPGDRYERDLASELVRADEDLTALASRLDTDPGVGRVVSAALRTDVPTDVPLAAGAPASEGTLGYLIAQAAPADGGLAVGYAKVRELRTAGGSWGVVAAIVEAEVGRVGAALSALLAPGTVPVLAGEPLDVTAVLGLGADAPDAPQAGTPDAPSTPRDEPAPPPPAAPRPTPSPSPPPPPTEPVTETVEDVVDTVLDLVSPSPSSPPLVTVPLPVPVQVPLVAPSPVSAVVVPFPSLPK